MALAARIDVSDAIASVWNEWQARPSTVPTDNGRRLIRVGNAAILVVWREVADQLFVFAAPAAYLAHAWRDVSVSPNVEVALVDNDGQTIAGSIRLKPAPASALEETGVSVLSRPGSETRLPWTLRLAVTSTPAEIAATGTARRQIIIAVLIVVAVLIPSTGYLVMRALNKELALARQQAAFVSAVSHEFRSPLTSLTHLTSLLRSDFQPTEDRRRQYYDVLAHETERLHRFVETVLDFGRIQAGATRYHRSPVDPAALGSGVVEEFRRHAAAGAHQVSFLATPVARVSADADALGRALWNLLENAAKYSPDDSPIVVRIEESDGRVAIRVSDQGDGIPSAEQPFIFDQFYRGAAASESVVKGTGIGLAMVRHIVHGHDGEVRVESTVGAGSTFSILLPAAPRESAGTSERRVS